MADSSGEFAESDDEEEYEDRECCSELGSGSNGSKQNGS